MKQRKDKMDTNDLIHVLAKKTGYTIGDCNEFLDAFINIISDCVKEREQVKIVNFGVLDFGVVKERIVHSKLLGDNIFPKTEKLFFRLSKNLKQLMKDTKKQENIEQVL